MVRSLYPNSVTENKFSAYSENYTFLSVMWGTFQNDFVGFPLFGSFFNFTSVYSVHSSFGNFQLNFGLVE